MKIELDERRPSRQIAELLAVHLEIPYDQRELFVKIARQERSTDRLEAIQELSEPAALVDSQSFSIQIPHQVIPIVGREYELAMIIRQLQSPSCRLLTLTGPGGVGKTRLAIEVAHRIQGVFQQNVCFVSLVGVSAHEFVIPAIAEALGFVFSGTIDLKTQLFQFLREMHILIVLDNLEHLLDGIEQLIELLEFAPRVKLLATSREQLHLSAEWVFDVQGLPVPNHADLAALESNSSVALFIQRCRQVKYDFILAESEIDSVKRICQLVEGLPLGLELAAAWIRAISVKEMAVEIERGLDFLVTGARDLPLRHRSMRAVFDHSWRLLTEAERHVLCKLSLFKGGFTRHAAEQVAGSTLQSLANLVDKSLVRMITSNRYELHELIRQYAEMHLKTDEHLHIQTGKLHASYYLDKLRRSEPFLRSQLQNETFAEMKLEIDNIRAAWNFAVSHEEVHLIRSVVAAMYYYYELHQFFQEAESLFSRGAEMVQRRLASIRKDITEPERARWEAALADMRMLRAFFLQRMGNQREAIRLYRANFAILDCLDEPFTRAFTFVYYGIVTAAFGDFTESRRYLVKGLPLARQLDHPWLYGVALCFLGAVEHDQGNYEGAEKHLRDAMEVCEGIKDPYLTLLTGTLFARTAHIRGWQTKDVPLLRESWQMAHESGNRWGIGMGLEQMALHALGQGEHIGAQRMLEESSRVYQQVGDLWSLSRVQNELSLLALTQGDLREVQRFAMEAFKAALMGEAYPYALEALAMLAKVQILQGQGESAVKMALFILDHPSSTRHVKDRAEAVIAEMSTQIDLKGIKSTYSFQEINPLEAFAENLILQPS